MRLAKESTMLYLPASLDITYVGSVLPQLISIWFPRSFFVSRGPKRNPSGPDENDHTVRSRGTYSTVQQRTVSLTLLHSIAAKKSNISLPLTTEPTSSFIFLKTHLNCSFSPVISSCYCSGC